MELKEQINQDKIPAHVAVIMDGNGRWAKKKGNNRIFGHKNGVNSVRQTVEAAAEIGIHYLTLYAFSSQNWHRPKEEINSLMSLLISTINNELPRLQKNNVKLSSIGDLSQLPHDVVNKLNDAKEKTANNSRLTLILALNYSGRWEIAEAARKIAKDVQANTINSDDVDENLFKNYIETTGIPDTELLIRTSGEMRLSNFLLWQLAYAELYFTKTLWPDFKKEEFYQAIIDFQKRERRFGKTGEQLQKINNMY